MYKIQQDVVADGKDLRARVPESHQDQIVRSVSGEDLRARVPESHQVQILRSISGEDLRARVPESHQVRRSGSVADYEDLRARVPEGHEFPRLRHVADYDKAKHPFVSNRRARKMTAKGLQYRIDLFA